MDPRLAFIFPGQGSQSVGMLGALAAHHPVVKRTFEEAGDVLGQDLWTLVSVGPEADLNATENTQPAMLAAGVAAFRVWESCSERRPSVVAGHSLGEYTALVVSGSLSFEAGIGLVRTRARFMQEAVPAGVGAMAAVLGLEPQALAEVCQTASSDTEQVSPANDNAPGQIVIAGHAAAVTRATELARAAGAKRCVILPVSVPSHCPLMADAATRFDAALKAVPIQSPKIPVIHNVDVDSHTGEDPIRQALLNQLCGSVRWAETIRKMAALGVDQFIECGPGAVLQGLNKRIVPELMTRGLSDPDMLEKARELMP
jgi:[acyl-carrier-protein] S-malonyltransferase